MIGVQLLSALTDGWAAFVVIFGVMKHRASWLDLHGVNSENMLERVIVMHTTLFLSVLTTQVLLPPNKHYSGSNVDGKVKLEWTTRGICEPQGRMLCDVL